MVRKSTRGSQTSQLSPSSSFRKSRRKNGPLGSSEDLNSSLTGTNKYGTSGLANLASPVQSNCKGQSSIITKRKKCLILLLGTLMGLSYFLLIRTHFDSVTNFSSLSSPEKELSLPSPTAFRYSFFKEVAHAESFLGGIRTLVYNNRTHYPTTSNAFRNYSLATEVALGGGFRLFRKVQHQFNLDWDKCHRGLGGRDNWKCSGLADPLTFYLTLNWTLDSLFFTFLFLLATFISETVFGGFLACLTFILNHPQFGEMEKMFPDGDKLGSYLAIGQITLLPLLLFTKSQPSWTPTVKMGFSVTFLILGWPKEAQWVLAAQLLVTLLMHFTNFISPFLISILIAAHITGWEYGSLFWLEGSLISWSFYTYLVVSSLMSIFLVGPILDRLFGEKLDKWMFLRATLLALAFYIQLSFVRNEFIPLFSSPSEDPRLGIHLSSNLAGNGSVRQYGVFAYEMDFEEKWLRALEPREGAPWLSGRGRSSLVSYTHTTRTHLQDTSTSSEETDSTSTPEVKVHFEKSSTNEKRIELQGQGFFIHLLKCSMSQWTTSIPMFIIENAVLVFISLVLFPIAILYQQRFRKNGRKLVKGILMYENLEDTSKDGKTDERIAMYFVSTTFAFLLLATLIHLKFKLIFLAMASIIFSLLPNYHNFRTLYHNLGCKNGKRIHWTILILILSLMVATAKLRLDHLYQPPTQENDSNSLGELLELTKWAKENQLSSKSAFLSPSEISIRLYTSTSIPIAFLNHNEESFLNSGVRRDAEVLQTLISLFSRKNSIMELHLDVVSLNVTHLVLSRDFCTQGKFPHFPTTELQEPLEVDKVKAGSYLPRYNKRNTNGFLAMLSKLYTFRSTNSADCDMVGYWEKVEASQSDRSREVRPLETLCKRILKSTLDELKPFTRPFQNRIYYVFQVNF